MSDRVRLAEAIEALRTELTEAMDAGEHRDLKFKVDRVEVELEVATERTSQGQAGLKFWVIEAGGQHGESTGQTHRVRVALIPQTPAGPVYTGDDQIPG